jgi:hypothetical protein
VVSMRLTSLSGSAPGPGSARAAVKNGTPSTHRLDCWLDSADTAAMGVRTRGLDIVINAKRQVADGAARAEAKGVVERWNDQLAAVVAYRARIRVQLPTGCREGALFRAAALGLMPSGP